MNASGFRAYINALSRFFASPLSEFPRQVVAPPVELQILVPLKPFVADLTYKSVGGE